MGSQSDFDNNFAAYVLFHLGSVHSDPTVYATDASDVCQFAYDESNHIFIQPDTWLPTSTTEPTLETLIAYALADVMAFMTSFYFNPAAVNADQPVNLSSSDISALRTSSLVVGYTIFNLSTNKQQRWNGSGWTDMW